MEKLGSFLNITMKKIGVSKKVKEGMALCQWEKEVGPQILQHTRAEGIKGGILFIHVENSHWAQHLSFYKHSMINKINHKLESPVVKDIHFKVGSILSSEPPEEELQENQESLDIKNILLQKEEALKIEESVKDLQEDYFKEKIKNIMTQEARRSILRKEQGWQECIECGALFSPRQQESICPICHLKK